MQNKRTFYLYTYNIYLSKDTFIFMLISNPLQP